MSWSIGRTLRPSLPSNSFPPIAASRLGPYCTRLQWTAHVHSPTTKELMTRRSFHDRASRLTTSVITGSSRKTSPEQDLWPPRACYQMRRPWETNPLTGEFYQHQCRHRRSCYYHAAREAAHLALAMDIATPTHLLTITLLPNEWDPIHQVMDSLLHRLRYRWKDIAWAYAIEQKPNKHPHAHILTRLNLSSHADLDAHEVTQIQQKMTTRFRTGDLQVQPLETGSHPSRYLLKTFRLESYQNASSADSAINAHLDTNGNCRPPA